MPPLKERIKELFAPSFRYNVIFTCTECGEYMFSMIVNAKSPQHAEQKALDRLFLDMGIVIYEQCFIHVEQI